jgi:hypothetical protein
VQEWPDLFAAALAGVGLPPDRVIRHVRRWKKACGPRVSPAWSGRPPRVTLTASRRLQFAAEASGVPAFFAAPQPLR